MFSISAAALLAYISITVIFVVSPGMATAVVLRNSAEGGRRAGVITAAGIAVGNASWGISSGLGLGLVLRHLPGLMSGFRIAGAVCLLWLGLKSLTQAWRTVQRGADTSQVRPHAAPLRPAALWTEGAVTNLLNPSIPVFYLATVPQFVPPGRAFTATFLLLTAIHVGMALACHVGWAVIFSRAFDHLTRRGYGWTLHVLTGLALILLAAMSIRL